jgi:hypothetical protein
MAFVHSPKIVTDGLVLALDAGNVKSYPGSGTTWLDKSGRGNNGTLINGPTFNSGNGGSIVFDGVDDYVDVNFNLSSIPSGSSPRTYCGWYNTSVSTYGNQTFAYIGYTGSDVGTIGQRISLTAGNTRVAIAFNGLNWGVDTISLSGWNFVSYTFDGSIGTDFKIYINSVLQTPSVLAGTGSVSVNTLIQTVRIGATRDSSIFQQGNISNFQIYNRALSASEVLQNYNATKGRFGL